MRTIRFRNDKQLRDKLYVPAAYAHPAKGNLYMWLEMIERYTQPGDTLLDPMSGVGASLLAALLGRRVVCLELEEHFLEPMRASWEKMRQHPMLGYEMGEVLILRGDARAMPIASADAILTSPPYAGTEIAQSSDGEANRRFRVGDYKGDAVKGMGLTRGYTRPDCIVTSPPYEGSIQGEPGIDWTKMDGGKRDMSKEAAQASRVASLSGYTERGQTNIGNLRNDAYWEAMSFVYQECYRVVRPGGFMALVLKGYTRDGQYVDLPGMTSELVQSLGFLPQDHWRRELWGLSFWRILQRRRDPEAFDDRLNFEEVLCFRKPVAGAVEPE